MRRLLLLLPLAVTFFLWVHCAVERIAGNASEAGNPTVVGILYEPEGKKAAAGVQVIMRPKRILTAYPGEDSIRVAKPDSEVTDRSGRFEFHATIDPGTYIIEAMHGNNTVLIDSVVIVSRDSTVYLPPDTLEPSGTIKGIIRLSEGEDPRKTIISAYGFERTASVGVDGAFLFNGLPKGEYHLLIWSAYDDYGVIDTQNISVWSAETTDIGIVELPLIGFPRKISADYDTLKQTIILRWNDPDTSLITGYNIYRRNIGLGETFRTPLNNHPVEDTVFSDSMFAISPDSGIRDTNFDGPAYEYCVRAVVGNIREGAMSSTAMVRVNVKFITPIDVRIAYVATIRQTVGLCWNVLDTTLLQGYAVYRRSIDSSETGMTLLSGAPISATCFTDTIGRQNQSYEYRVASILKNQRATVMGKSVMVRLTAP